MLGLMKILGDCMKGRAPAFPVCRCSRSSSNDPQVLLGEENLISSLTLEVLWLHWMEEALLGSQANTTRS